MRERYFTLEEATALLPRLTTLLTSLKERRQALQGHEREQQSRYQQRVRVNGHAQGGDDLVQRREAIEADQAALRALAEEIQGLGIEVKDLDTGLVDFPAWREGRVVYLCWRLGEPAIAWWHDLDTGFAGRQPL